MYVCVPCMSGILGGQKKALDPLELQAVVSHLRGVPGTGPQSSGRVTSTPIC